MTTISVPQPTGAPQPGPTPSAGRPAGPPARAISWQGVRTITVLELRQRVRSTRWKVALIAWFCLVGLVMLLLSGAVASTGDAEGGRWIFGLILLFVLGLGLLVAPTLSSTAINGDRNAGTLAILQVTLLSPADIAVGKLLAGWTAALAFLAVSLPFLIWAALLGGTDALGFFRSLIVLALLLAVVCAIGLGFSALTAKTAGSSVLTYVAVASLTVISLVLFALSIPTVTVRNQPTQVFHVPDANWQDTNPTCEWERVDRDQVHTERTWWLLGINPFVVMADAGPAVPSTDDWNVGPLEAIRSAVQLARHGAQDRVDECYGEAGTGEGLGLAQPSQAPIWPWGLATNLLLGGLSMWVAIRRLSVPYRKLPTGTRVA